MTLTLSPGAADIANPSPRVFTIDQLVISPLNVRFNEVAIEKVDALRQQIVEEGLLQPLVVHPVRKRASWAGKASHGVFAGGRRFRAIRGAIEAGQLPPDFPVNATVRDLPDGEIILLSLIENIAREDLLTFETSRGVARARAEGLTIDQIATKTGQRRRWVEQQLRLGELAPEVFAAFIAGTITIEQAMAYAATGDHALQAAAWAHFTGSLAHAHLPSNIRAFFKIGDRELTRNLQFVGEAIYRGNGGRFELDLFADGPDSTRGRVTDEPLLARLVAEKMEVVRNQVRAALGERELRFQAEPPRRAEFGGVDTDLEVRPKKIDWETVRIPRGADPADFVATIEVEPNGDWTARLWWKSRAAKTALTTPSAPARATRAEEVDPPRDDAGFVAGSSGEADARRIVRDEHGLTADGINVVRSIRRDLLRALLLTADEALAGDVPRDYFTWSTLRDSAALAVDRPSRTGARGLAGEGYLVAEREPADLMVDQREGQEAAKLWSDALALLRAHPAFAADVDAPAALRVFLDEEPGFKRLAEAVLAGLALVRSAATPGWRVPVHDVLAEAIGGAAPSSGGAAGQREARSHVRRFWHPTPAFTGLFGKMARQEMVQPFVDEGERRALVKARDRDLSRRTAEILAARPDWLHPLLAFAGSAGVEYQGYLEEVSAAPEMAE